MKGLTAGLIQKNRTKIILTVLDGLGGLPVNGRTELEAAHTPNMDALAKVSACGLHLPVSYGITPGSGPGHLALFGFDPGEHQIGRGVLEALGLDMDMRKTDLAVRGNYATTENGIITDRRAGRIPTVLSRKLTEKLQANIKNIDGVEILFSPGMEHRFALIIRFPEALGNEAASIDDTDPQKEGLKPLKPNPRSKEAEKASRIIEKLVASATGILKGEEKANSILLRGFSVMPALPSFQDAYGLDALAVANYPMYRGLAKLTGMHAPAVDGEVKDEIDFLKKNYDRHDFFFLHIKKVDSYGEDGDFNLKAGKIEEMDGFIPEILELNPDVLVITGDHSTPALVKGHSWHPVPVMLKSPYVLGGTCSAFSERECLKGELGIFSTVNLMPLILANSGRLKKFGA